VFHVAGADASLKPVLFMSHMDVVPIEEVSRGQWSEDPLGGKVADGVIWGRGTLDDKSKIIRSRLI
jgi:carboxypeptidase PM20D1